MARTKQTIQTSLRTNEKGKCFFSSAELVQTERFHVICSKIFDDTLLMNQKNPENISPYITVKQACRILNCGRTKIYTHYIHQGLLEVKKKAGNKSLFLREDVERVAHQEQIPQLKEFMNQGRQPQAEEFSASPSKLPLQTEIYRPASRDLEDEALGEYINSLKQKIHDLETELLESRELLEQYKSRQLKSISLVEYTEKMRQRDRELGESRQMLELSEQRTRHLEQEQRELNQKILEENQRVKESEEKFTRSLRVALTFKQSLKEEEEKRQAYEQASRKLRDLYRQLEDCRFWEIGLKRRLRTSIEATLTSLRKLEIRP